MTLTRSDSLSVRSRPRRVGIPPVLSGLVLVVLWSSGFVGAELGTRSTSTVTLLTWRFVANSGILLLLCLLVGVRFRLRTLAPQALIGVLCQVLYLGPLVYGVELGVSGGVGALITSMQPLLVAVLAGPLLGERTSRRQRLGLVIGLLGVTIVVAGDLGSGIAAWWAYLLPVLSLLSLGVGTVLGRRWTGSSMLEALAVQTVAAAVVFGVVGLGTGQAAPQPSAEFLIAVAWVALLSGLGGYGSYLFVLRQQGATRVSSWLYLTPPVTMLWSWLMFGSSIGVLGLLGLLITAAGVALVILRASNQGDE